MNNTAVKSTSSAKSIAINGLSIALVFVATGFINIKLPIAASGGLVHLGNIPLFLAAIIFGKKTGAIAGSIGMALFDIFSGWALWAPFTFVVVGIMGYTVGKITEKDEHNTLLWYVLAILAALIIKIVGYYIAEGIIYGNWIAPVSSIPGNIVQVLVAAVIVLPLAKSLKKQLSAIARS
ncbi:MAG: ECF transporter S component [Candidatus Metalachnospira sp.]|nr:ECF transporter S component [Candidatus Metalachnospira sp.]